jgi:hypothetical protein
VALVLAMTTIRFCGDQPLPPKPAGPTAVTGTGAQLLSQSNASQRVYLDLIARDAAAAGVPTPSIEMVSQPLAYEVDATRHVLEVGQPAITLVGLELRATQRDGALALTITNTTGHDVGYRVVTSMVPSTSSCTNVKPIAHNAMVLAKGDSLTRAECGFRADLGIAVTAVETVRVPPLAAFYLGQVPPAAVGIEPRIARGHVGLTTKEPCVPALGQALRTAIENGKITWRDLVDFYARHRCQTYQFPLSYRAITESAPQALPAAGGT